MSILYYEMKKDIKYSDILKIEKYRIFSYMLTIILFVFIYSFLKYYNKLTTILFFLYIVINLLKKKNHERYLDERYQFCTKLLLNSKVFEITHINFVTKELEISISNSYSLIKWISSMFFSFFVLFPTIMASIIIALLNKISIKNHDIIKNFYDFYSNNFLSIFDILSLISLFIAIVLAIYGILYLVFIFYKKQMKSYLVDCKYVLLESNNH